MYLHYIKGNERLVYIRQYTVDISINIARLQAKNRGKVAKTPTLVPYSKCST